MEHRIVFAGFGGQGVLSMGMLVAYAGMIEDKEVSWLPSYGPEMRGGTANCNVIVSDAPVSSPIVTVPTAAVVMNRPSLDKFGPLVEKGGILLVNSSLIDIKSDRTDIDVFYVPANDIAAGLNTPRAANMVMLGAFLKTTGAVSPKSVMDSFLQVLGVNKASLIPINEKALEAGLNAV
ncbi:MAG: 2-oxoacid:ferredoxin oxidoreductase subunit gamma [Clostridiales bacterium]|jgi:2-oxoglutarate ferredoxin oxidoreductase subunit gamma|nr:2-oxoacid:ferredoxin oxidoreductase subunit gamma [Clostridiales bacterium]